MGPALLLFAQAITWQWVGGAAPSGMYQAPRAVRVGALECSFVYEDATHTSRTSCAQSGRELWRHVAGNTFVDDTALLIDGNTLYSAQHSDISTGCTLHAIDALTGRERWAVNLLGLGPIGHSKYYNVVQLRAIGGQPVVFGWEAAGRYIESRDARTGVMVSHQLMP